MSKKDRTGQRERKKEREERDRGRLEEGEKKGEVGENQIESVLKGGRGPMNKEIGRKSTNRKLVPPWNFSRTSTRGVKR